MTTSAVFQDSFQPSSEVCLCEIFFGRATRSRRACRHGADSESMGNWRRELRIGLRNAKNALSCVRNGKDPGAMVLHFGSSTRSPATAKESLCRRHVRKELGFANSRCLMECFVACFRGDDGTYWMQWEDFCKFWGYVGCVDFGSSILSLRH